MGYAISWIAFQGRGKEQILAETSLQDSGELDEYNESPISGAEFSDGWYIIVLNEFDHTLASRKSLENLSASCQIVSGMVEEHVMFSTSSEYRSGRLVWRISHDAQKDIFDLTVEGDPPEGFKDVKERLWGAQEAEDAGVAEVDHILEIPLLIGQKLCGFKHDESSPDDGGPKFTRLTTPAGKSMLYRLFGR